jgi:hypothetical protein
VRIKLDPVIKDAELLTDIHNRQPPLVRFVFYSEVNRLGFMVITLFVFLANVAGDCDFTMTGKATQPVDQPNGPTQFHLRPPLDGDIRQQPAFRKRFTLKLHGFTKI